MAYSNGKISAPVAIYDIQQALNVSSVDLGTLCRNTNVNMWAKFKPVVWYHQNTLAAWNGSQNKWNGSAAQNIQWWRGSDGNYGLDFSGAKVVISTTNGVRSALNTLATKIDGNTVTERLNGWTYQRPHGAIGSYKEFYRQTDFAEYNHAAVRPISSSKASNIKAGPNQNWDQTVNMKVSADVDISIRDYIVPQDVTGNIHLEPGLVIYTRPLTSYVAMAWCTGLSWGGIGVKDSSYSPDYSEAVDAATFYLKNGGNYYVLPVFFGYPATTVYASTPFSQPDRNKSAWAPDTSCCVVTVPYAKLLGFTAVQKDTNKDFGSPKLTGYRIALNGSFNETLYLDDPQFSSSPTSPVDVGYTCAIINELFTGTFASGTFIPASYYEGRITSVTEHLDIDLYTFDVTGLDRSHTWSVYLNLDGEEHIINLIQSAQT